MKNSKVENHFDKIAKKYDYFKKKNWYYYKNLKYFYKEKISSGKRVLEVGCGTGDIISSINVSYGLGIDISSEMIDIAKQKHPHINFESVNIENFKTDIHFDYVFLADVIEHLENMSLAIESLKAICDLSTKVIFTYANPLWEPILIFLEKMKLKMPEGPHYRIPYHKFKKIYSCCDFIEIDRGWRLLIPAKIPFISYFLNSVFYNIPLLKRIGMLEYVIIKKK